MSRLIRTLSLSLAASALAASGGFARAAEVGSDTSRAVHYAPAALAEPAGVAAVYRRLQAAARVVCGDFDAKGLARMRVFEQCVQRSLAHAVADIDAPALTAYHERHTGAGAVPSPTTVARARPAVP